MSHFLSVFPFRFAFPWALLLFVLVPWSIWLCANLRSLSPARKVTAASLRSIIVLCLVLAVAGLEMVRTPDLLAVFFLLDRSDSVPVRLREAAVRTLNEMCGRFQGPDDLSGVIAFGEQPSIELAMGRAQHVREIRSSVRASQTDLAAAMRLATSAFPQGSMKRMVIFSDGNETRGDALEETRLAQSRGIAVDVVPLHLRPEGEVRVKEVSAPNRVSKGEPFRLRVVIHADRDSDATLRVFQRVREGRRALEPRRVALSKGDNVFLLSQELHRPGFYEYDVEVASAADTVPANNEGRTFTLVKGRPVVLYVEADREHGGHFRAALESEGLNIVQTDPARMPASPAGLADYEAVVLSNVSATDLNAEHLHSIQSAVRDLGIGLVMIGGPRSFGAGGFLGTPVEIALPVDMDIRARKNIPRGALVLIMHTCEMPEGNAWAREIGLAALNTLSAQDLMAALGYYYDPLAKQSGDSWIFSLREVGDKRLMRLQLTKAASQLGDMPDAGSTLETAYQALIKKDAAVKRVVMISDGDPAAPTAELLGRCTIAGISVSTVCIAPHSPNDADMLRRVAEKTGGRFYNVTLPGNLPQIFAREAAGVRRGILMEETFTPEVVYDAEMLAGLLEDPLPQLRGHVLATPKDKAVVSIVSHHGDPVLAHWRYGLGKAVAFTSDITGRWAANWLQWKHFDRFWAQTVRWAMRDLTRGSFRVQTSTKQGKGRIRVDAVDREGRFVNFLQPKAVVSGPGPEFRRFERDLVQTGPGIYEAAFPVSEAGNYMINVVYSAENGSRAVIPAGLSLGYSPEYERTRTNLPLLKRMTEVSGGRLLTGSDNPFRHDLSASQTITPLWQYLALMATLLVPLEVFVRRVMIRPATVYASLAGLLRRIPGVRAIAPRPRIFRAPLTGRYGRAGAAPQAGARYGAVQSFGTDPAEAPAPADEPAGESAPSAAEQHASGSEYTGRLLAAKRRTRARLSSKAPKGPGRKHD